MPHQKLDRAQVHTGLQKMGGKARPKAVNATALFEPRSSLRRVEDVPGFTSAQGTVLGSVGEKPDRRSVAFPILTQVREQVLRPDRIAVLAAFAPCHTRVSELVNLKITDIDAQRMTLRCRIRGHQ